MSSPRTVGELIEDLKQYDPNTPVVIRRDWQTDADVWEYHWIIESWFEDDEGEDMSVYDIDGEVVNPVVCLRISGDPFCTMRV